MQDSQEVDPAVERFKNALMKYSPEEQQQAILVAFKMIKAKAKMLKQIIAEDEKRIQLRQQKTNPVKMAQAMNLTATAIEPQD